MYMMNCNIIVTCILHSPLSLSQPLPPPFYPPPRSRSNTGPSVKQPPIPIPAIIKSHRYVNMPIHKQQPELSEQQMDELCKSVTEHALDGMLAYYYIINNLIMIVILRR